MLMKIKLKLYLSKTCVKLFKFLLSTGMFKNYRELLRILRKLARNRKSLINQPILCNIGQKLSRNFKNFEQIMQSNPPLLYIICFGLPV